VSDETPRRRTTFYPRTSVPEGTMGFDKLTRGRLGVLAAFLSAVGIAALVVWLFALVA
jgi:hypothetical protein